MVCRFFKRHGHQIKMQKEVKLVHVHRNLFSEDVSVNWFDKLKNILHSHNLHARSAQIWNCDESGFSDETQWMFTFFL